MCIVLALIMRWIDGILWRNLEGLKLKGCITANEDKNKITWWTFCDFYSNTLRSSVSKDNWSIITQWFPHWSWWISSTEQRTRTLNMNICIRDLRFPQHWTWASDNISVFGKYYYIQWYGFTRPEQLEKFLHLTSESWRNKCM